VVTLSNNSIRVDKPSVTATNFTGDRQMNRWEFKGEMRSTFSASLIPRPHICYIKKSKL